MGTMYTLFLCGTRRFRQVATAGEPQLPDDVKETFAEFADGGKHLTKEQLRRFLIHRQGSTKEEAIAESDKVFDHIYPAPAHRGNRASRKNPVLSFDDFFHRFLFNAELNPPIKSQVQDDNMSSPLSHYYIYTGHNSYLTGNQLSSKCSVVPIMRALQNGVRVIELDMWPNSTGDDIDILHGRTLTPPVKLIDCLKAIKYTAFSASPYTTVITLEDHLSSDLQAKAAKMITETYGDLLYCPESETTAAFPSPLLLMNRIMVSTKPPKEFLKSKVSKTKEEEGSSRNTKDPPDEEEEAPNYKSEFDDVNDYDGSDDDEYDDNDDEESLRDTAPEYKRIIAITAGKPKGGLKEALSIDPNNVRRLSLSEKELLNASEHYGADIVRFTQKNIMRIYPKGTRIGSSNYNPFIGWMHGAQMVAFNMQGYGKHLWIMQGFFRANGGCGYVKKPEFLMNAGSDNRVFDPWLIQTTKKMLLKVKVYMGDGWRSDFSKTHFDRFSPPDLYTRVGIAGVPEDEIMKKTTTKNDSWRPIWNEEFSFSLAVPELAVVRIEVRDHDMSSKDDFGGQTCLPFSSLRPGIRSVPLFDSQGIQFESVKLLMGFEFC